MQSRTCLCLLVAVISISAQPVPGGDFPAVVNLPVREDLPDPLTMLDGTKVESKEQWLQQRRPELAQLFQHYMYGYLPERTGIRAVAGPGSGELFGGKAAWREVVIHYGPEGTPPIGVLVVQPRTAAAPVPVFVGINFCGNHTVINDPGVTIPSSWYPSSCPGCEGESATAAGRGGQVANWNVEMIIDRGYALATFYYGDVDPDKRTNDFTDGVHPHFYQAGQTAPGPHDWGAVAAWAYGVHRVVDYLVADKSVDSARIALVGHSRLGKATLLAGALDDRIALVIPHQAGCGGTAPSRGRVGEPVERINTVFPHWFNDTFPEFNKQVEKLPFDQHCLVAMCAPRPVLLSNAVEDQWANPDGQFEMLQAADPVYQLVAGDGLAASARPVTGVLIDSRLGYFIRPGKHSMSTEDWEVFLTFADRHLKK